MNNALPSYVAFEQSGELADRATATWQSLAHCELCPHRCGVDRLAGEQGRADEDPATFGGTRRDYSVLLRLELVF